MDQDLMENTEANGDPLASGRTGFQDVPISLAAITPPNRISCVRWLEERLASRRCLSFYDSRVVIKSMA